MSGTPLPDELCDGSFGFPPIGRASLKDPVQLKRMMRAVATVLLAAFAEEEPEPKKKRRAKPKKKAKKRAPVKARTSKKRGQW